VIGEQRQSTSVLVIGGGVGGVAVGRRLAYCGVSTLVLERSSVLGGAAGSFRVGRWRFDVGLHCFFTTEPRVAAYVNELMGDGHQERSLRELVWYAGEWRPYPPLRNLACYPESCRALGRALTPAAGPHPETNAEAAARSLVGDRLSELFVLPRLRAFWGVDPASLPASVVRGAAAAREEIQAGARAPLDQPPRRGWHYPIKGGFVDYVSRLSHGVPVRLGTRVTGIDPSRRQVSVTGAKRPVRYGRLISSLPLPELARLATGLPADLAEQAAKLRHSSLTLVSLGVSAATPPAPWVYTWDPGASWYRASFPAEFDPTAAPPGTNSVQTETYWHGRPPDPDRLWREVVRSLRELALLPRHATVLVRDVRTVRYANTYANTADAEVVAQLQSWFAERGVACVGRYGRWDNARFDQVLDHAHRVADGLTAESVPSVAARLRVDL
jgi:protoporphyrinogen oxidase